MAVSDVGAGGFRSIGIRKILKIIMVSGVVHEVPVPVPGEGQ
jgi:hypothetical protein